MASSPRILNRPTDRHHQSRSNAKARLAVHHRSACSANLIAGDGTKNGFSRSEQRTGKNKTDHLTGKAPYKFESISLQR
jgi:hypothetical protein